MIDSTSAFSVVSSSPPELSDELSDESELSSDEENTPRMTICKLFTFDPWSYNCKM